MAQGGEMNDVGRDTALALRAIVAYENGVLRRLTVRAGLCYVLAKYSVYATLAALADAFAQVWSDGMLAIRGVLRTDVEGVFESKAIGEETYYSATNGDYYSVVLGQLLPAYRKYAQRKDSACIDDAEVLIEAIDLYASQLKHFSLKEKLVRILSIFQNSCSIDAICSSFAARFDLPREAIIAVFENNCSVFGESSDAWYYRASAIYVSDVADGASKCNNAPECIETDRECGESGVEANLPIEVCDLDDGDLDDGELDGRLAKVMRESFSAGYDYRSSLMFAQFCRRYRECYDVDLQLRREALEAHLRQMGEERGGKLFVYDEAKKDQLLREMWDFIERAFDIGATCVCLDAIVAKYRDRIREELFVGCGDADALVELLESVPSKSSAFGTKKLKKAGYLICRDDRRPSFAEDVRRILKSQYEPMSASELAEKLWFLSDHAIKMGITWSGEVVVRVAQATRNNDAYYFYAKNLPISAEGLRFIAEWIGREIARKGYAIDEELRSAMRRQMPSVADDIESFTTYGLRNCLAVLLGDQFDFNGRVMSAKGVKVDMSTVIVDFCRKRTRLTFDELQEFADEVNGGNMYIDKVMEAMLRIDEDTLVVPEAIEFDVLRIDAALGNLIDGDYTPFRSLQHLHLRLPHVGGGLSWNNYLLESYVAHCSQSFVLLHQGFCRRGTYGAIGRRDSAIRSFDEMAIDALACDDTWKTTNDALRRLYENGYLAIKAFAKIDEVVKCARARVQQFQKHKVV